MMHNDSTRCETPLPQHKRQHADARMHTNSTCAFRIRAQHWQRPMYIGKVRLCAHRQRSRDTATLPSDTQLRQRTSQAARASAVFGPTPGTDVMSCSSAPPTNTASVSSLTWDLAGSALACHATPRVTRHSCKCGPHARRTAPDTSSNRATRRTVSGHDC